MHNMAQFAAIEIKPCALVQKWVAPFILSQHHGGVLTLELIFLKLQQLVHQTRHHVFHRKLFHEHYI